MAEPAASGATLDFGELLALLSRAVARSAPPWMRAMTDDIVQVAMERLAKKAAADPSASYNAAYLMRVAHHAVIDEMRRLRRRREVPLDDDEARTSRDDPERAAHATEISGAVSDCLSRLKTPRRRAVALHLLGHSLAETAGILAATKKRAENLVYRGLAQLRQCLTKKGVTP